MRLCVRVCACVCARVCACVCARVCARVQGISAVKLYAWEDAFMGQVIGARDKEARALMRFKFLQAFAIPVRAPVSRLSRLSRLSRPSRPSPDIDDPASH